MLTWAMCLTMAHRRPAVAIASTRPRFDWRRGDTLRATTDLGFHASIWFNDVRPKKSFRPGRAPVGRNEAPGFFCFRRPKVDGTIIQTDVAAVHRAVQSARSLRRLQLRCPSCRMCRSVGLRLLTSGCASLSANLPHFPPLPVEPVRSYGR